MTRLEQMAQLRFVLSELEAELAASGTIEVDGTLIPRAPFRLFLSDTIAYLRHALSDLECA